MYGLLRSAVKCAVFGEPPEVLRPVRLDHRLRHPAEQLMIFREVLNQAIGAGSFPCSRQVPLCLLCLLEMHIVHNRKQVQANRVDRVSVRSHTQGCRRSADAFSAVLLQYRDNSPRTYKANARRPDGSKDAGRAADSKRAASLVKKPFRISETFFLFNPFIHFSHS